MKLFTFHFVTQRIARGQCTDDEITAIQLPVLDRVYTGSPMVGAPGFSTEYVWLFSKVV